MEACVNTEIKKCTKLQAYLQTIFIPFFTNDSFAYVTPVDFSLKKKTYLSSIYILRVVMAISVLTDIYERKIF